MVFVHLCVLPLGPHLSACLSVCLLLGGCLHVCVCVRMSVGVPAVDPPRRGPPPPIPSYRQHMDSKSEGVYIEVSPVKDSDGNRKPADEQSSVDPSSVSRDQTPVAPPRRKTISGRIPRSTEPSPSAAKEGEVKHVDSQGSTPAKGQSGMNAIPTHADTCRHMLSVYMHTYRHVLSKYTHACIHM